MEPETWYINKKTGCAHFILYGVHHNRQGLTACGINVYNEYSYVELTDKMDVPKCKICLKSKWRDKDDTG